MLALEERSVLRLAEESENAYKSSSRELSPEKWLFREEQPRRRPACASSKRLKEVSICPRPAAQQSPYSSKPRSVLKSQSGYRMSGFQEIALMLHRANRNKENAENRPKEASSSNSTLCIDLPSTRHKSLLERSVLEEKHRYFAKQRTWSKLTIRIKKRSPDCETKLESRELPLLARCNVSLLHRKSASPLRAFAGRYLKGTVQTGYVTGGVIVMETRNPDEEVMSWKAQLAPAIVISCESHYGAVPMLPTFPWYLEQAPNPEVKELLSRLTFATKHSIAAFSSEVANYLERLSSQIQDKIRFKYCNHLDLVSVEKKVAELKNPKPGGSRLTVKVTKGQRRTLGVSSKTRQSAAKIDSGVTVDMSLDVLSVEVEHERKTVEVFSGPPKDMLTELSLERLMQPTVVVEQDVSLDSGERMTLEMTVSLAETDKLEVLQMKVQRLEEIFQATEREVKRLKDLMEGVMSALDIKDEPRKKKEGYRDRGCEYCVLF